MANRSWHERAFGELTAAELYAIVALRERVFVVEQACAYLEADGADLAAHHLWATDADELVAYLRVLPAGVNHADVSIGRVLVVPTARGGGLARELMTRGLGAARALHGDVPIVVGAQAHLQAFYASLGFAPIGDVYDDHGIPHVDMRRLA